MIAAVKPLSMTRAVMARPSLAISKARKSALVVRSAEENKPMAETNEDGTVFYAGKTFASEEEVSIFSVFHVLHRHGDSPRTQAFS